MAVSLEKARHYVYGSGVLYERALFGYLFDGRPLAQVHQCLRAYKNPDGGWGHDLEHDIKCPESHPLALEFLLTFNRSFGLPLDGLLEGAAAWVEANRQPDGSLRNPDTLHDYPLAPWWQQSGGQTIPASLTGGLLRLGLCSESLAESTRRWVQANLSLAHIRANEWLFMAYHAFDYFMYVADFPDIEAHRRATLENIIALAEAAPENQYYSLFHYVSGPEQARALGIPQGLLTRCLDYLEAAQQEDGSWVDQHGIATWYPHVTILVLLALRRFGRLAG